MSEFSEFFNQKFGNCFTFNNKKNHSVTGPGPSQGLKLLLTVEEEEYMPQVQSVGVKMVVHSQDALPFPENDGILLSPGSLTQNVYQRTGPPYGDCVSHSTDHNLAVNMYAPYFAVSYSAEACFNTCYQVMVASECGCCDPDFPCSLDSVQGDRFHHSYNHTISPGILYCDFKADATAECVEFVKAIDMTEDGVDVNPLDKCVRVSCPLCLTAREEVFQHQVSVAAWPTLPATQGLVTLMGTHFRSQHKETTVNAEFLNRNIIRVEVFMSQLNVEKIVTEPAYDWLHLLSDVGGQVSLWLGFSLMTAVELCQLLVDLLGLLLAKLYTYLHTPRP
ncbi:degenerin deg-1-like [Littorina saxatilis]|uniref:degenerin deg-1-like n=1 Tax=Littorina saxatilis TaxID=31220 RepID=UPI0038B4FA27